jgi:radical SAM protein with 4Fe4S-binding SPASM domain
VSSLRSAGDVLAELSAHHPFPLDISLGLTDRCNLRCGHCFVPRPEDEKSLSTKEISDLLDDLAKAGVLRLSLTGGEVGLRQDLERIVEMACEKRFHVHLKTNGTLLNEGRLRRMMAAGLYHIDVSMYSDEPEAHDVFVKKPGAWRAAMDAAECFRDLGGYVHISTVLLDWNAERVAVVAEYFERRGFTTTLSPTVVCSNDGSSAPGAFRTSLVQLESVLTQERFQGDMHQEICRQPSSRGLCAAGIDTAHIGPEGDVYLCQRLPWSLGNVREMFFRDIWTQSEKRREFVSLQWQDLTTCGTCDIASLCQRCPANALLEQNDLVGVAEVDCMVAQARAALVRAPGE